MAKRSQKASCVDVSRCVAQTYARDASDRSSIVVSQLSAHHREGRTLFCAFCHPLRRGLKVRSIWLGVARISGWDGSLHLPLKKSYRRSPLARKYTGHQQHVAPEPCGTYHVLPCTGSPEHV